MRFIFITIIIILCEIYFYSSTKSFLPFNRNISKIIYLWICIIYTSSLILLFYYRLYLPAFIQVYILPSLVLILLSQLVACIFFLIDDLRYIIEYIINKIPIHKQKATSAELNITRSTFIKWIGLMAGGGLFAALLYGSRNKYNYQVIRKKVYLKNLPNSLKGLKIAQISDIHSGSFNNEEAVEKGIKKLLQEKPDLIVFTGDLVNNVATEIVPYKKIFQQLNAPLGVYSILGNHDYGDYEIWDSQKSKNKNLDDLKNHHKEMGWNLLLNENKILVFNDTPFALIGVENWPAKNFVKYGDLKKSYQGTENIPLKILLSHDPSHWEAEVIPNYPDISLTLSGHTHGMQFGIEIPWLKWSPVKYFYKQWAGLYSRDNQHIYVNRGYGFIGYQGRVGILPEITILELT